MRVDTVVQEGRRSPADSRGDRNLKSLGFSGAPFHKTYITNPAPALWSLESGLTLWCVWRAAPRLFPTSASYSEAEMWDGTSAVNRESKVEP